MFPALVREVYNTESAKNVSTENVPEPKGWKILIAMPKLEEKTAGGVYRPDQLKTLEETASILGYVVKVGDLAYKDEDKFKTGAWCKEGDWIVFRSYAGTRFKVKDQEFRLINDDTVEGVVTDPRDFRRA